jgi:TPR repeat protein
VACFLLLAVLLYSFRETIGRSLISLGQKLSAPSETSQAQVPDTAKPTDEVQQPAPANPSIQPAPANPDKENNAAASSQSQAATSAGNKSEAIPPPADREKAPPAKEESQFRDQRPGSPAEEAGVKNARRQDPAEEVRALWSAVGQGNTSAEVTLAKLYLIGGGVKKNCDQARVLLRAAAKKGNTEAIAKLSQLTRQGCP